MRPLRVALAVFALLSLALSGWSTAPARASDDGTVQLVGWADELDAPPCLAAAPCVVAPVARAGRVSAPLERVPRRAPRAVPVLMAAPKTSPPGAGS